MNSDASDKVDDRPKAPSEGSILPESTVRALEAMEFSTDQPFDAASLSDGDLDFDDSGTGFQLNDMPDPAPIVVPSAGVQGNFAQSQDSTNTSTIEAMAAFDDSALDFSLDVPS